MEEKFSLPKENELENLYQRNVSRVYKLCYIYLKNSADAEDAVQSIFLKLLQTNIQFNDVEHEKAWIITATKNHCKDILKSWWKRQRVDFEKLPDRPMESEGEKGITIETEIMEKLLSLPQKYKTILYLYYFEEYSVKEIASLLGRNESTVRSQLQRGREKLKMDLGGESCGEKRCEYNSGNA